MMTLIQNRNAVEKEIRTAFQGITLGKGTSLRQAQEADGLQVAVRDAHTAITAHQEITDDWSMVSLDDLERDCIGHLDPLGFRYYLPALMLSVLDHYDPSSLRVIGTLGGLYPKRGLWAYHMRRYSLLNVGQKTAIAHFLAALPKLVRLGLEHQQIVDRALRNYWGEYLQPEWEHTS